MIKKIYINNSYKKGKDDASTKGQKSRTGGIAVRREGKNYRCRLMCRKV